ELGRGGMGLVHLAEQRALRRPVAIKRLQPFAPQAKRSAHSLALITEAQITGALEHPNIIPVHSLGRDHDGQPVLVMKRVEGVTWSALLADPSHPHWQRVRKDRLVWSLEVFLQLCNAVSF